MLYKTNVEYERSIKCNKTYVKVEKTVVRVENSIK